jgi:hypothetical protein
MSSVSCGIVGLPNAGKSTLFNALTNNNVLAANYPFATIEPNTGIVPVPDNRLNKLAEMFKTERIVPATVTFVDIAGLVEGASKGEGLGNQFLGHIRTASAIVQVVRAFEDSNVIHVGGDSNPKHDIDIINTELILADLQTVDKRLPRLEKEAKADSKLRPMYDELTSIKKILESGVPLSTSSEWPTSSEWLRKELQLLTMKPVIYVFNVNELDLVDDDKKKLLGDLVLPNRSLFICAKLESELHDLDEVDSQELLVSYGVNDSGLTQLIHTAYDVLGLQSFLTAGVKEVRAWTISKGSTAPQAAGTIHSDFERGFIAAQVVDYQDLIASGSEVASRAAGKIRTEGRDYVMQPNDVVEFRFNVSR